MVVALALPLPAPLVLVTAALGLVLVMPALGLVLLALPLALLALAPAGTTAQRLEQLKTRRTRQREPDEASGLVRGWRQLPLQGGAAASAA